MGTPFYMSPEQARGDRNLDARVDLWAAGVILYEAITGRRPFIASNYNALLLQILTAAPRPARELRPTLPMDFDRLLERSMARAREDRYATAHEFQQDLALIRGGGMDSARPPPMAQVLSQMRAAAPLPKSTRSAPPPRPPMVAPPVRVARPEPPAPVASAARSPSSGSRPRDKALSSSDPLARLPSLEARYDDEASDTSGTQIAIDLLDSGETDTAPGPPPAFDDLPTEVVRSPFEDTDPTRRGMDASTALRKMHAATSRPKMPARAPSNIEDTVKIEGDIEEHFKRMHPESKSKIPRSRRPK
jgi:serine/threonine-protein kinase